MKKDVLSDLIKIINKDEIIISFIIFCLGIFIYIESTKLPDFRISYESPGLLPAFVAICMLFLSLFLIGGEIKKGLSSIKEKGSSPSLKHITGNLHTIEKEPLWNKRVFITILIIILYIIALPYLGFLYTSAIFLFILMIFLHAGNIFLIVLISIFIPIAFQYLFVNIFKQLIP